MLKLTLTISNLDGENYFYVKPSDIKCVYAESDGTCIQVGEQKYYVKESAEDIGRYLLKRDSYSVMSQDFTFDTVNEVCVVQGEELFDAVDYAICYSMKYLENKIAEQNSTSTTPPSYYQSLLESIEKIKGRVTEIKLRVTEP